MCSVLLLLAFALILNVNATSAATVNGTSNINSSVKTSIYTQNLTTAKAYSIVIDKTKPKIIKTDPVNRTVNVSPSKIIKITFNEPIKFGNKYVVLSNNKGNHYSIRMTISGNVLTIVPYHRMINGMLYYLIVHSKSIKDLSGNSINLYVTNFKIATAQTHVSAVLLNYLQPTANSQSSNPTIKAYAAKITSGKTSSYSKAAAIFNWVRDHISYSFYYNTKYGALGTLKSRSANCVDTSHLMVALERAAGLPARYQHGTCRFSSGTYGHVWAQVYVNSKWYYADGTSSRNSFGVIKNWNTSNFILHGTYASLPF